MKDLNGNTIKITDIQLYIHKAQVQVSDNDFEEVVTYSANIIINNSFVAQVSGDKNEATFDGVCDSIDCFWNDKKLQDRCFDKIDSGDLENWLESQGFENNQNWLENAPEVEVM